jgi:FO synthase
VDALVAIRDLHEKYGHIQEVIVQNFRAKSGTPMAHWPEPDRGDMLRTLAVARLLMPRMNIQAPPNLSDTSVGLHVGSHYADLLDGGINDWGGVSPLTPDFINPEKPWPHLDELRRQTEAKGFELRQRLPVYPEFANRFVRKFAEQSAAPSDLLAERLSAAADAAGYARRAA